MRSTWAALIAFSLGLLVAYVACVAPLMRGSTKPLRPGSPMYSCNPKEVNVNQDSVYKWSVEAFQKTVHVSIGNHEVVAWTFDRLKGIDSVTAVFGSGTPFASAHFSFADSAAFSGAPVVGASGTTYNYTITVYPHGHVPVTADPGIIIDM
jgi:hypothetical protein